MGSICLGGRGDYYTQQKLGAKSLSHSLFNVGMLHLSPTIEVAFFHIYSGSSYSQGQINVCVFERCLDVHTGLNSNYIFGLKSNIVGFVYKRGLKCM